MSGLGGLNKSKHGVVMGLVQLQLPVVVTPADLAAQTQRICDLVAKARRNQGTMDLVVFPEYALHGLSMDTNPAIMCSLDGPEVAAFRPPVWTTTSGAAFRSWKPTPQATPTTAG
jgi:formamidase